MFPEHESAEAVRLWLSEQFAAETDPLRILRTAAEAVGRFLGAARVGYAEIEPDFEWMDVRFDWAREGVASMAGRHRCYPDSALTRDYRRGRIVVLGDLAEADLLPEEAALLAAGGNRSLIAVPLIDRGRLVALFTVLDDKVRTWGREEVRLVAHTGGRVWSALEHLRLTEKLRESEEQFRLLAENLPGLCWVFDRDGRLRWANRHWHELFDGTAAAEGDPSALIHPDDLSALNAARRTMREGEQPVELRVRIRGKDGTYRSFLTKAGPVRDASGAAVRWCGVQIDLTEKHAIDQRQALLRAFHDRTRDLTGPVEILTVLSEMLTAHFGISHFLYVEAPDGDPDKLEIFHAAGATQIHNSEKAMPIRDAFAALSAGHDWVASRVVDDNHQLARDPDDPVATAAAMMGVRSGLNVPIVKDGKLVAAMAALHEAPRHWKAEDIQLCEELAERVWATVSRARAEAQLREREQNQKFLIEWNDRMRGETSPDAIVHATLECLGRHLGVSRITYSESDESGRVFTVCDEWRDGVSSNLGKTITLGSINESVDREWVAGELVRYDDVTTDPRVTEAAAQVYAAGSIRAFISVPLLQEGAMRSILSVQDRNERRWRDSEVQLIVDIAQRAWVTLERARAQMALQARERNQAFLIDWSDRVRGEASADAIMSITLEALGRHLGITRATYSVIDESGRIFTIVDEWRDGVASVVGNVFALESVGSSVDREWMSGALVCYHDVSTDARLEDAARQRYLSNDIHAFASVPLVQSGMMRSALSVQHNQPRRWAESEIQLIRDIAERTWVALERARAQSALQERERGQAFLIEWSDRLRGETSPDVILSETLERIGDYLGASRANFAEAAASGANFTILREWRRGGSPEDGAFPRQGVSEGVHEAHLAGEIVLVTDVHSDPRFSEAARERYVAVEATAFLGIPLVRHGEVHAVLSVQQSEPRAWLPAEVQLLRDVAERTWAMLERARAEAALQDRERVQAFLVQWNDSIRNESNPRAILSQTLAQLGQHLGVTRTNFAEATDRGQTLRVLQEWKDGVARAADERYPLAMLGARLAAAHSSGRPVRVDDIETDPRFDEHNLPLFRSLGIGAVLTLPMMRGGEILAVLSVQQPEPRRWTDSEVDLVREIADRTLAVLERAHSEERLAESEAQLSAFLENAPLVMHMKDAEGRYIRINPEFAEALGRPMEELTGTHPDEIFPPEIAVKLNAIERRARGGEVASAEIEMGLGERYASVLSIVFPITGGAGVAKTAGFTIDLTERKRAEAALARSREALYQTEKISALGSLLAGVSHELNNPLSIVVAQAVMMERQARGSELAERAQKIRRAADRCARIVQTFLAMARQKRPERASVDLNEVVTAAHDLADYGLRTDGIATVFELAPSLPRIAADSDQLHQVIINLIVNAQQAMAEAAAPGRTLTLRTALGAEEGTVILDVADNGPGIPEEARRRIFEPFFTTKPQGYGTGVGLSFSQGLAEAHGGRLELAPSEEGACFRLTLPIEEHVTLRPIAEEAPALAAASAPRRALVIDDEQEIAESLADFLSLEGFDCDIAVGGASAKAQLAEGQYDLIVSDLRMPEIDGPQLHAWIAAERPDLMDRVAFATGDTLGAAAERFLDEVKRPVLEKPFMPDAVHRFLKQMDLA